MKETIIELDMKLPKEQFEKLADLIDIFCDNKSYAKISTKNDFIEYYYDEIEKMIVDDLKSDANALQYDGYIYIKVLKATHVLKIT